jgi:hypothetical protein
MVGLTLQRIRLGYWMPTEKDDGVFFNFAAAGISRRLNSLQFFCLLAMLERLTMFRHVCHLAIGRGTQSGEL